MTQNQQKLYETAEAQEGYFTYRQAIECGYSSPTHVYHIGTGAWIREYRGIFRLARFPTSPEGHYALWTLWSCNRNGEPQGVYSHQTALSIHELSDIMPAKIHMTVPPRFRRNSAIPKVLVLHKSDIPPSDIERRQGYAVVKPLRAVTELLSEDKESRDRLQQALSEGMKRGIITRAELAHHGAHKVLAKLLEGKA